TEFTIPSPMSGPHGITSGPDGALWFVEPGVNKLGRITTFGSISESAIPTAGSGPLDITTYSPEGDLYFTENSANKIGLQVIGALKCPWTECSLGVPTANSGPWGITSGPDGNLWFTEQIGNKVARFITDGSFTEFPIPTTNCDPEGITSGPG